MNDLIEAVTRFRAALQEGVLGDLIQFADFPHGSCGDTCLLLARWLEEQGFGRWQYWTGWRGGRSHAWLQRDGVIIDVTANQFPEIDTPVIVTTDATWHRGFNGRVVMLEAFSDNDPLTAAYKTLVARLTR